MVVLIAPVRVASVPAAHPYVRHLSDPDRPSAVIRLPDPAPAVAQPIPGQWWPPRLLDPGWVQAHHEEFDLLHLHFGFDASTPGELSDFAAVLRRCRRPLVFTVHDLLNPHFVDPERHRDQLDVLVPAAAELITLTPGAASVISRRWGRTAAVIPHPHVVPLDRIGDREPSGRPFVVGIHAKSLRANIDPVPLLHELTAALPTMPGVVLRLDVHPDVLEPGHPDRRAIELQRWIAQVRSQPGIRIEIHPRMDDGDLWTYLESLDLCILPYRFGTHSGWLEACVDLGTAVLAPSAGCYHDQHGHPTFRDRAELVERVRELAADPSPARPSRPDRPAQRRAIAVAHERVYRRALAAVAS
ncbi:hypothetical protein SAMN04515671_4001 [Nakamurella panacisegetis]|uniref:Uncharacterized protein n=1 Tax=Nakamurella panacisegetis TaxID=1090615 RepID=A0A1H0SBL4_9ACTN|nr:glycosyltransferase family 1 protein [Nakamurella panacisegetis]SDP38899.1 hypothetical protein SAMN04515671_4001 [Nakamurella panacisegetis]